MLLLSVLFSCVVLISAIAVRRENKDDANENRRQLLTWGNSLHGRNADDAKQNRRQLLTWGNSLHGRNADNVMKENRQLLTWGNSLHGRDADNAMKENRQLLTWGNSLHGRDADDATGNKRQLLTWGNSLHGRNADQQSEKELAERNFWDIVKERTARNFWRLSPEERKGCQGLRLRIPTWRGTLWLPEESWISLRCDKEILEKEMVYFQSNLQQYFKKVDRSATEPAAVHQEGRQACNRACSSTSRR
nr:Biomphalaria glabrata tigger transposable element-derived protein 1-like [Biomphalaria glabrata]